MIVATFSTWMSPTSWWTALICVRCHLLGGAAEIERWPAIDECINTQSMCVCAFIDRRSLFDSTTPPNTTFSCGNHPRPRVVFQTSTLLGVNLLSVFLNMHVFIWAQFNADEAAGRSWLKGLVACWMTTYKKISDLCGSWRYWEL